MQYPQFIKHDSGSELGQNISYKSTNNISIPRIIFHVELYLG